MWMRVKQLHRTSQLPAPTRTRLNLHFPPGRKRTPDPEALSQEISTVSRTDIHLSGVHWPENGHIGKRRFLAPTPNLPISKWRPRPHPHPCPSHTTLPPDPIKKLYSKGPRYQQAITKLNLLVIFFLLWPGEYCRSGSDTQSTLFRLGNVKFFFAL